MSLYDMYQLSVSNLHGRQVDVLWRDVRLDSVPWGLGLQMAQVFLGV